MRHIKCVLVGDGGCPKTQLLLAFTTNALPGEYIPTVLDNYSANMLVDNYPPVNLQLWDTAGQEDYKKLRPLSYPQTDVFILCFSLVNPTSLENVEYTWYPEIQQFCPGKPMILAGLKLEKRDEFQEHEDEYRAKQMEPVPTAKGLEMAKKLHLNGYFEVSVYDKRTMDKLFEEVVRQYFNPTIKYSFKICIIGPNIVKDIALRIQYGEFLENQTFSAKFGASIKVESELCTSSITVFNSMEKSLSSDLKQLITDNDGFMIVYDVDDKDSFDSIDLIIKEIKRNKKTFPPCIIAGDKSELPLPHAVQLNDARNYSRKRWKNIPVIEISSKLNKNIEESLESLFLINYGNDNK